MKNSFKYIVVGAGLAGASAIEGIREIDKEGSVLLIGREEHLPYHRPPLSKKLWFGKEKIQDVFIHDRAYYEKNNVTLLFSTTVTSIDAKEKAVHCSDGQKYQYGKLALTTGGEPRKINIPGGDDKDVCYYRYLDDYEKMRGDLKEGSSAVIIGGGFIGSEIAAALNINKINVTMIFPDKYLVQRVFPESLGRALQDVYVKRGINIFSEDLPVQLKRKGRAFITVTRDGKSIESDAVIVGVGINPSVEVARAAGLTIQNGIIVDQYLKSSNPDIFAAGDVADFPYIALSQRMRVEHWDNALNQGKIAGKNMAGAGEIYDYMPYFFSDLFEFGYEAVGQVDSRLETVADWEKENEKGIIYYVQGGKIRGAMMCNVWNKVEWARDLIRREVRINDMESQKKSEERLPNQEISQRLSQMPEWSLQNGSIEREFTFQDFHQAMNFVSKVAQAAEEEDHHPDIHISYNKVKLDLSTHKAGGITNKDFVLATKVSHLG